jgi:hypothetical protein
MQTRNTLKRKPMILLDAGPRAALSICAVAAFVLISLYAGFGGMAALGQTVFDPPEVRTASDVVSPAFTAPSDARFRRLVREIAAIAELQQIHQSDAFAKATVAAGKGVIQDARQLIEDPVAAIGAVPEAVFSVFGRVAEATGRSGRSLTKTG